MKTGITFFLIILLVTGCFHRSGPAPQSKWDAMLQMEINKNHENPIHFSGLCSKPITDRVKHEMEKSGIVIQTRIDDKFTAIGNTKQIRKLSRLRYVKRLEGAKPVKMH
ncbi:hypothetical protein HQ585_06975 [candidate division KSB1 bacterium]|nr:hypothetical protein [candidate division KSB1 bacterium]